MKLIETIETGFEGLVLTAPKVFPDDRGFFFESFHIDKYASVGISEYFVQDNISKSCINTLRGLHFQVGEKAQGKLCQVIKGSVLDVVVDLRVGSPTFSKYYSVVLSEQNHYQLYIPVGFAHGFSVLSDDTIFHYKCTNVYSKVDERALLYNDSEIGIDWQNPNPIVSEKDKLAIPLSKLEKYFYYKK